ncbi:MAG: hypothetical protein WC886_07290 [Saccharofermentanaceae bacterium]|jgi:hypothetical protein
MTYTDPTYNNDLPAYYVDADDLEDVIPDPEFWHFPFRDGSEIALRDFEEPIISGKRKCLAREVADWIETNEASQDQAIHYILTNYKS